MKKELYSIMGGLPLISHITRKTNLLTGKRLKTRGEVNGKEHVTGSEGWRDVHVNMT